MNYRHLLLISALALAACDGSDSSAPPPTTNESSFSLADGEVLQAKAKGTADKANADAAAITASAQAVAAKLIDDAKKKSEADAIADRTAAGKSFDAQMAALKLKREGEIEIALANDRKQKETKLAAEVEGTRPGKMKAFDAEIAAKKVEREGKLDKEIADSRPGKLAALDTEMAGLKISRTKEVEEDLEKDIAALRVNRQGDLDKEIANLRATATSALDKEIAGLKTLKSGDFETEIANLKTAKSKELEAGIAALRLERQGDLDKEIADLRTSKSAALEAELADLKATGTKAIDAEMAALKTTKLADLDTEMAALKATKTAALDTEMAASKLERQKAIAGEMAALKASETDKLKLELARLKAGGLSAQGKVSEAAASLREAGLISEAGTVFAEGGLEDEAFDLLAPQDSELKDPNAYNTSMSGSIQHASVIETASAMRHSMKIDGKTVKFTARAGHLTAKGEGDTRAAVFYTAYTRDGLPHNKRPVTFFWNGGPGSASIWLHLGSWGPKRLKSNAPDIPKEYFTNQPTSFPFEDNAVTLLDKSDLVFVDPPGTGLSTAIAPSKNQTFWGVDVDTKVIAGFIAAYTNRYNRQSSPKYLYGESYGGIRTPIVADILLKAGTGAFAPDISGKPTKVLNGIILNSPILDYTQDCGFNEERSVKTASVTCSGHFPSYAMTANYFGLPQAHKIESREAYLRSMTDFTVNSYMPILAKYPDRPTSTKFPTPWVKFSTGTEGTSFFNELYTKTGISSGYWKDHLSLLPGEFRKRLIPDKMLGRYDARMALPSKSTYRADEYIDVAFANEMKTYLPDFVNYKTSSIYAVRADEAIDNWAWSHRGSAGTLSPASTADLMEALTYNPSLKLLVLHGYEDVATPGFQTELNLKALVYRAGADSVPALTMLDRMPVKWFEGGHMTYNTEESRQPLKAALDQYYNDPDYSLPAPATTVSN